MKICIKGVKFTDATHYYLVNDPKKTEKVKPGDIHMIPPKMCAITQVALVTHNVINVLVTDGL